MEAEEEEDESFDPDNYNKEENGSEEYAEEDEREKDYKRRIKEDKEVEGDEPPEESEAQEQALHQSKDEETEEYDEEAEDNEISIREEELLDNKLLEIYQQTKSAEVNEELFLDFNDFDVYELKLSNLAYYQKKCFDKNKFQLEPSIIVEDDKGRKINKRIPHENYIRWIYQDNNIQKQNKAEESELLDFFSLKPKANQHIQTNLKGNNSEDQNIAGNSFLIEMKDGSFKIQIGNSLLDVVLANSSNLAFAIEEGSNENISVVGGLIKNKMIVKKSYQDMFKDNRRKSSLSNEDLAKYKTDENKGAVSNAKTKMAHSYFDKNKFSREEYTAKNPNSIKKIEQMYKKNNTGNDYQNILKTQEGSGSGLLNKKRKTMFEDDVEDDY